METKTEQCQGNRMSALPEISSPLGQLVGRLGFVLFTQSEKFLKGGRSEKDEHIVSVSGAISTDMNNYG